MKATCERFRTSLAIVLSGLILVINTAPALAQDPGAFNSTGNMIVARWGHSATLLHDGRVLVVGGYNAPRVSLSSAELYDPPTGTFVSTGSMNQAFEGHSATLLQDGRVLITGSNGHAELYNPVSGTFAATGNMIAARPGHTATLLLDGKVLITGSSNPAELYDPSTGSFTPTGSTINTSSATANLLPGGRVLLTGSFGAETYDPLTGTFNVTGSPAETGLVGFTSTSLANGWVLLAGGGTDEPILDRAELYLPESGIFTRTGNMTVGREGHTATLLNDGTVLVAGGIAYPCVFMVGCAVEFLQSAELYNLGSGAFGRTGDMLSTRWNHTATLLKNGQVLIAGGIVAGTLQGMSNAELFVPGNETTLSASPSSTSTDGTVTVAWAGVASASSTDWIGLYQPGAPDTALIDWIYVSCSKTASSPQASGSCPFVLPGNLPPETYQLRLFANNSRTVLATSNDFTVTGGTTLTASPTSIGPGGVLTATWAGIPSPSATDWIGLYQPGAPDTALIDWIYVSCSKTASSPQASGSCPFVLPGNLPPETYQLRLFANNSRTVLATSNDFTVTGGTTLTASPTSIGPGGVLTATWAGIPSPSATDWIGLYQPGAPDTALIDWIYVSCSKTASSPQASGSCPFVLPGNLPPETYQLRLFANNSRTVLATSYSFTVQ